MGKEKTKICSGCKGTLPVSMFHKNKSKPDGLSDYCKDCSRRARLRSKLKPGEEDAASSLELLDEALDSCLERLCEIEENILQAKASAEAVKAVMVDLAKANKLSPMKSFKNLRHGSFRYYNRKLTVRLKS